jgi:hypothetical protein
MSHDQSRQSFLGEHSDHLLKGTTVLTAHVTPALAIQDLSATATLTFASWNHIDQWLRQIDTFRQVA